MFALRRSIIRRLISTTDSIPPLLPNLSEEQVNLLLIPSQVVFYRLITEA